MWEAYRDMMRADFTLFDEYSFAPSNALPFDSPITALWATRDKKVKEEHVKGASKRPPRRGAPRGLPRPTLRCALCSPRMTTARLPGETCPRAPHSLHVFALLVSIPRAGTTALRRLGTLYVATARLWAHRGPSPVPVRPLSRPNATRHLACEAHQTTQHKTSKTLLCSSAQIDCSCSCSFSFSTCAQVRRRRQERVVQDDRAEARGHRMGGARTEACHSGARSRVGKAHHSRAAGASSCLCPAAFVVAYKRAQSARATIGLAGEGRGYWRTTRRRCAVAGGASLRLGRGVLERRPSVPERPVELEPRSSPSLVRVSPACSRVPQVFGECSNMAVNLALCDVCAKRLPPRSLSAFALLQAWPDGRCYLARRPRRQHF